MNEADWTPSPLVERETVVGRRRLVQHDWIALTGGAAGVCGLIGVGIYLAILVGGGILSWVLGLSTVCAGVFSALRIDRRREALVRGTEAADRALAEEFGGGHGFLVDLIILQGAAPTGSDRGVLWIEDCRLFFSGHRTSFALYADQIAGPCRHPIPIVGLRHGLTLPLTHRTDVGSLSLSLAPRADLDGSGRALHHDLSLWVASGARGDGQFPPTVAGPGMPVRKKVFLGALTSTLFWAFLLLFAWWIHTGLGAVIAIAVGAFVSAQFGLGHPVERWRAWRDLGKVRR